MNRPTTEPLYKIVGPDNRYYLHVFENVFELYREHNYLGSAPIIKNESGYWGAGEFAYQSGNSWSVVSETARNQVLGLLAAFHSVRLLEKT